MWRKGLLFALGFVCAGSLLPMWLSGGFLAAEAPQIKMSIKGASASEFRPGLDQATRRGKKWVVVVKSVEGKEYDEIWGSGAKASLQYGGRPGTSMELTGESGSGTIVLSPDGKRVAYAARNGTKWVVVVDGVEGKEYDTWSRYDALDKENGSPIFSPDGQRVAHVAKRAGKWVVVVDGVEGKEYDGVRVPVFSPDSKRVAYWACLGGKFIQNWVVVVNGIEGKEYRRVSGRTQMVNAPPIFSPDSKRVAYYAEGGGKALIVVDDAEGKEYEGIGLDTLVFSPDSKRVAYLAQRSYEKWVAVVDGVEGKEYEEMVADTLVFSPDSQRVAYATGSAVVVDGVEKKEGGEIGSGTLLFSPDSQRLAYWVSRGKKVGGVVVDGVAGKEYERIAVATPVFSPDSKHMAYGALTGGKFLIVVDGVEGNERDFEGFFNVRDSFNVKGITLVFDSPTQFHAYALRGKAELVRVDVEIGTVAAEPSVPK